LTECIKRLQLKNIYSLFIIFTNIDKLTFTNIFEILNIKKKRKIKICLEILGYLLNTCIVKD